MVSEHGIEANRDKITAVTNMGPIRGVKGVQRLTGCLASLSQFIARLGERGLPLHKLLKKSDTFVWTEEAQVALDRLKALLPSPPVLSALEPWEPHLLYFAATNHVVSAALVVEREEQGHALKVQRPIYFVSEVLTDTKITVPSDTEASVRRHHGSQETPTLLHRARGVSRHLIPTRRSCPQPRRHGTDF